MNKKNVLTRFCLSAAIFAAAVPAMAQDVHFTQFDMAPLVINPAFTGMFDGQVRAGAIYRNQWKSVTIPYVTYGAHVDMPLYTDYNGGYLAGGMQVFNDKAGDGNLQNFTGLLSIAYHKLVGRNADLAVGLQGGYAQKSIDLSRLYFGDEAYNGTFVQGTSGQYASGIGNSVSYYLVNAGLSLSGGSENFSYVIGLAANNINQPNDALLKKQSSQVGLDMRYTGELGLNVRAGERLTLRPAVLYQSQASASEIIGGNEFLYQVASPDGIGYSNFSTAVFLGGWYRTGDAVMITGGVEFKGVRIGLGYDYNISTLNTASNGNGGFEIAIRYIAPSPMKFSRKRVVPCSRF